ncbi:hypothetical protein N7520_009701 [Penicillium odoratum]|uniref:uncharacterized protein n=1 Tax=Penicillium odoratum TaxID=1167516 RepID=UPI0025491413|nr:uncharacterized protein N7520_009701 [Penicillium odoratum]KAJ5752784.1 hypothetical protein N7520_009701 [Penicillium odoratum]
MSSNSAMGVVKNTKKDAPGRNKNPETLQMLLEEAQKAAPSDRHNPDVDGQDSTTGGHEDNQQSTDDIDEDPPHPKTSKASHDIQEERHPEPVNTDEHGSRNVEMLDAGSAEDSSSDPAMPVEPDANIRNGKLELLEDFGKLNIGKDDIGRKKKETKMGGRNPADIDWFGGKGTSRFCIFRTGPSQAPRYEFHRTTAYSVPEPKCIYERSNRISQLRWEDENGNKHWQYTRENIGGTAAITVAERDDNKTICVQCPQTWVKIEWKNIKEEHQELLIGGYSWIPRSDMIRLLGEKQAAIRLQFAWDVQEHRYVEAMRKKGRFIDPLTFPLYTFNEVKMERERSRSQSVMPSSFLTSDRLPSVAPIGRDRLGVPTAGKSMGVKEEEEEQYAQRTAPSHLPGETGEANVTDRGDRERAGNKRQTTKTFNVHSYLATVERVEKWSEADKNKRRAIALANYDHYKEAREALGDKEED